jgi:hypothetical protein
LLRRHWSYALGQRLDYLGRNRSSVDRCSLVSELIGEIPDKVDYYSQAADLKATKELFPEYKNIYADLARQQRQLSRKQKGFKNYQKQPKDTCKHDRLSTREALSDSTLLGIAIYINVRRESLFRKDKSPGNRGTFSSTEEPYLLL